MSRYWNQRTLSLTPYVAGEQPRPGQKVVKLNTNENPYPPSPKIAEYLKTFDPAVLRLYPEPTSQALREALADFFGVRPEQVFCGNGSDEVLAFCFQAFFETENGAMPLFIPDISYSFYPVYAKLYGIPLEKIPLNEDFTIPVERFCQPSGGVAIATPNAPTTLAMSRSDIKKILESQPDRVVLIDQAYAAFGEKPVEVGAPAAGGATGAPADIGATATPTTIGAVAPPAANKATVDPAGRGDCGTYCTDLLNDHPNLLIIGTLSKSHSLAGLRVGYAIASEELIDGLKRIRDSFNSYPVDTLALQIATLAVRDTSYNKEITQRVIQTRERAAARFAAMGCTVLDSRANFLFVKPVGIEAEELYKKLRVTGILVRYFDKPRISEYLRISIGTDEDMDTLFSAIEAIMKEKSEGNR